MFGFPYIKMRILVHLKEDLRYNLVEPSCSLIEFLKRKEFLFYHLFFLEALENQGDAKCQTPKSHLTKEQISKTFYAKGLQVEKSDVASMQL